MPHINNKLVFPYGQIKSAPVPRAPVIVSALIYETLKFKSDRSKLLVKGVSSVYVFTNLLRNMLIWTSMLVSVVR